MDSKSRVDYVFNRKRRTIAFWTIRFELTVTGFPYVRYVIVETRVYFFFA